jgi:hypothetical protein
MSARGCRLGDREKLEKLCRHAARPAVAESRLVELCDGGVVGSDAVRADNVAGT